MSTPMRRTRSVCWARAASGHAAAAPAPCEIGGFGSGRHGGGPTVESAGALRIDIDALRRDGSGIAETATIYEYAP